MTQRNPIAITRRKLLLAGAAVPLCAILTRPAAAAEFTYKLATGQDPTHPVNVRAKEAPIASGRRPAGAWKSTSSRPISSVQIQIS